jgi:hypothetical protein
LGIGLLATANVVTIPTPQSMGWAIMMGDWVIILSSNASSQWQGANSSKNSDLLKKKKPSLT